MATEMTKYVIAAVLNHIKRFDHWHSYQLKSEWHQVPPFSLSKAKVGIMGLGYLGQHAANVLTQLGINVCGYSRSAKKIKNLDCFSGSDGFNSFLNQTDVLVCLLPLTSHTENILNKDTFAQLPKNAFVINVARGKHLIEADLMAAIDSGHLSGAQLDVFREEPLPEEHPFWQHPKIRVTPHIASVTNPKTVAAQIVENYHRMIKGEALLNTVDLAAGY